MALVRCLDHGRPDGRRGNEYSTEWRRPVGHPDSALICGRAGCRNPGVVWLLVDEERAYGVGERIFGFSNGLRNAKFRVL